MIVLYILGTLLLPMFIWIGITEIRTKSFWGITEMNELRKQKEDMNKYEYHIKSREATMNTMLLYMATIFSLYIGLACLLEVLGIGGLF